MSSQLHQLYKDITDCSLCPLNTHRTVGYGNQNSSTLFLGLNPHMFHDKESDSIFCFDLKDKADRKSGHAMKTAIQYMNHSVEDYFWYNFVCCAHESGKPTEQMYSNCTPYFFRLIDTLKNLERIVCLGTDVHDKVSLLDIKHDIQILKVKHPAYYLYKHLDLKLYAEEISNALMMSIK